MEEPESMTIDQAQVDAWVAEREALVQQIRTLEIERADIRAKLWAVNVLLGPPPPERKG